MLIMPPVPSASYFAPGFEIISIDSIVSEVKLCQKVVKSLPDKRDCTPFK